MKQVEYRDRTGRLYAKLIPDGASVREAGKGLHVGPPLDLKFDLPEVIAVRLHNELYHRQLFTVADVTGRRQEVFASLQSALGVETESIVAKYVALQEQGEKVSNGS